MPARMIEFPSNGSRAPGHLSVPPAGPGPGVVVIQEWWGLVDHITSVADRLAGAGFTALAPDLYHGRVVGLREPDEAGKAAMALDMGRAARDLCGAVDHLVSSEEARGGLVGVIGFCMGGGLAVQLATLREAVAACVDYYGIPGADAELARIRGHVLGHFAEQDQHASPAAAADLGRRLDTAGVVHQFHTYPGTQHAFFNDDREEVYDEGAARQSWERTLTFLRDRLG
ncbi:MAG TPA: dienelactone hydrolase family protein [Candidatus Micrarchaeia archaeon]|nr:dienelactone hydrolase family protein [Candidatus Micrarchaeia archaeon]